MARAQLSKNFFADEFACKCGCGIGQMNTAFIAKLQLFRDAWGKPMKVTSGLRCLRRNIEEKGKPSSRHLIGMAADILVAPEDRWQFVRLAFELDFRGIGVGETFIHLDGRSATPALWVYS
jgi:uncharacterized protein YcbK (DUF882 family)